MNLKDALTAESLRLEHTIANNNDLSAIRSARTRWENAHRAYFRAVCEAQRELRNDKRKRPDSVCALYGVDPTDLMEVTEEDDSE